MTPIEGFAAMKHSVDEMSERANDIRERLFGLRALDLRRVVSG